MTPNAEPVYWWVLSKDRFHHGADLEPIAVFRDDEAARAIEGIRWVRESEHRWLGMAAGNHLQYTLIRVPEGDGYDALDG